MGYDGRQVYQWFQEGKIDPLTYLIADFEQLVNKFEQHVDGLHAAQKMIRKYSEGEWAESATGGVNPLVLSQLENLPQLKLGGDLLDRQADMFLKIARSVEPVPDEPSEPSAVPKVAAIVAPGPIGLVAGGKAAYDEYTYRQQMAEVQAAKEHNERLMAQYSSGTDSSRSAMPEDFGIVRRERGSISIGDGSQTGVDGLPGSTPTGTTTSFAGGTGSGGFGSIPGGPGVGSATGVPSGGGLAAGGLSGAQTPAVGGATAGSLAGSSGAGMPRPIGVGAGFAPMPLAGAAASGLRSSANRAGALRGASGMGSKPPVGGSRAGSRILLGGPKGAGVGAGLPKAAVGAGAGAPKMGKDALAQRLSGGNAGLKATAGLGSGRALGAGSLSGTGGGAGQAAASAAKGGGVAGGRGGMPMGAAGAGGRGGKGDDDKEHQRKYVMDEEIPVGIEENELGEMYVPGTKTRVAPQVIGDDQFDPTQDPRGPENRAEGSKGGQA